MKGQMIRFTAIILSVVLLATACPVFGLAATPAYGDPDNSGSVDATDALLVLRAAVDKYTPTSEQQVAGDVNGDQKLDASDALLILQYAVKKIDSFPVTWSPAEKYYKERDAEYKVNYSDFDEIVTIQDVNDAQEILEKMGGDTPEAPVEITGTTADGLLSYTPISKEAIRLGQTKKYQKSNKVSGTLRLKGTEISYSIPATATAYDAVPIEYSMVSTTSDTPVYLEAVAFEEADRYLDSAVNYYDCNLPGTISLDVEYLGYVLGYQDNSLQPNLSFYSDNDKQGVSYPDYTTTELVKSGTLKAGATYTWFKWKFTNTGNTILDGEGNSCFRFEPRIFKKNGDKWMSWGGTHDDFVQFLDYVYPGESGEFWTAFCQNDQVDYGIDEGEYRIVIYGYLTNEQDRYDFTRMQLRGDAVTASTFEFSVTKEGAVTPPQPVVNEIIGTVKRNTWLGNFEEFMSSYTTVMNPGKTAATATTGVLYVQPAPWTDQIVLKVIHGEKDEIQTVRIPLQVETDSIHISLNEDNENWVINQDGTRAPMVYTQNMSLMRGGVDEGPYNDHFNVNILRDMQEAGINTITTEQTTCGFTANIHPVTRFMLDCARKMGFWYEGHCAYDYRYEGVVSRAAYYSGVDLGSRKDMQGYTQMDAANGILARGNMIRYGDFYVYNPVTKEIPISLEENYGWFTYSINNRSGINTEQFTSLHKAWLKEAYNGDIQALNEKYGKSYKSFEDINVAYYTLSDGVGYDISDKAFKNWTAGSLEMDLFRTVERTHQYEEMLKYLDVEGAKVYIRSENAMFMAPAISPTTDNVRYRSLYYEQRQTASVPEILAASGIIYGDSGYCYVAYTPSEVYELTRQSGKIGLNNAKQVNPNRLYDPVVNETVGAYTVMDELSTGTDLVKWCWIMRNMSLFTWCKAIYEGGGVPGLMWMDDCCGLYATTTQYKELQFFNQKIKEMLATPEGKAWANSVPAEALQSPMEDIAVGAYSYPEAYIEQSIASTPRWNKIMDFVTEKN